MSPLHKYVCQQRSLVLAIFRLKNSKQFQRFIRYKRIILSLLFSNFTNFGELSKINKKNFCEMIGNGAGPYQRFVIFCIPGL